VFDGKGKGGVVFKDIETALLDQKIAEVGVIIDTGILVNVWVETLPDIVTSSVCSEVGDGDGDVMTAVPFKLGVTPLILDSVGA
jgi:hypothetical protein